MKTSEIKFTVTLDEAKVPESIQWEASDLALGEKGKRNCQATMLTAWDGMDKKTLRIDLWTKDMSMDDMKRFFYENLMTMAETYRTATNDAQMSKEIKKFAENFGRRLESEKKLEI